MMASGPTVSTFNNLWEIIRSNPNTLYSKDQEDFSYDLDLDHLQSTLFEINIYGHKLHEKLNENDIIDKNTIQGLQHSYPKWFDEKNCCTGLINQNFHCTQDFVKNQHESCVDVANIYPLAKSIVPPAGPHQNEMYPNQYDYIDRTRLGAMWEQIKCNIKENFKVNIDNHESAHNAFAKYITAKICIYAPPFSGKTSVVTDLRNHGIPATETDIAPTINQTYLDAVLFTNNTKYLRNAEIKIALIPTFYEFSRRLGCRKLKNNKNTYLQAIKAIPINTNIILSDKYIGQLVCLTKSNEQSSKLIIKNDIQEIGKNWYFSKDNAIKHEIFQ